MRWTGAALVSVLLLTVTLSAGPVAADSPLPRFEQSRCPFPLGAGLVDGVDVRCGYLVVPADRQRADSPLIRLAVADFKSGTADPDPLIYLQGGPGAGIVDVLGPAITKDVVGRIAGGHDLILVDQRGTGLSKPSLSCPEPVSAERAMVHRQLTEPQLVGLWVRAAGQCHDRLVHEGVDPTAYTTEADAADIAALGPALGYQQVDLYGISYGTRVALTTMRLFPSGIRSVVLDGVLPPQVNFYTQYPLSPAHAYSVLVAACAAASACNHAYPSLNRMFVGLVHHLNARPATVALDNGASASLLTGDRLARLVFAALYDTRAIPIIPYLIDATAHGHYDLLASAPQEPYTDHDFNLATYYSMLCSEDAPFVTPAQMLAATAALPAPLRSSILTDPAGGLVGYAVCKRWAVAPVDQAQKTAVTSAIPTLVLAGEYDPITPPSLGLLAAQTLSHSYVFTYPGVGHGAFLVDLCASTMTLEFLNNPTQSPAAGCMSAMKEPQFLVPPGPSP
jgi:pimeloyl-ACP methyl ester carboxylesterase